MKMKTQKSTPTSNKNEEVALKKVAEEKKESVATIEMPSSEHLFSVNRNLYNEIEDEHDEEMQNFEKALSQILNFRQNSQNLSRDEKLDLAEKLLLDFTTKFGVGDDEDVEDEDVEEPENKIVIGQSNNNETRNNQSSNNKHVNGTHGVKGSSQTSQRQTISRGQLNSKQDESNQVSKNDGQNQNVEANKTAAKTMQGNETGNKEDLISVTNVMIDNSTSASTTSQQTSNQNQTQQQKKPNSNPKKSKRGHKGKKKK